LFHEAIDPVFGEKIRELVKPISHLHGTFTIPKMLRACPGGDREGRRLS